MAPIVCLASKSMDRNKLFKGANIDYEAITADIDETRFDGENPKDYVLRLAEGKARAVSIKTDAELIVGGDTIVVFESTIFGKPKDRQTAIDMLNLLQGNTHSLVSGLAVYSKESDTIITRLSSTEVEFDKLTIEEIEWYVDKFEPYPFAGAYEMNSISSWFIPKISGSPSNVVGLPMADLRTCFDELGYSWKDLIIK